MENVVIENKTFLFFSVWTLCGLLLHHTQPPVLVLCCSYTWHIPLTFKTDQSAMELRWMNRTGGVYAESAYADLTCRIVLKTAALTKAI